MAIHIRRRAACLIGFGLVWVDYGWAVHSLPQTMALPPLASIPTFWVGMAWIVTGAICIGAALLNCKEWYGFIVAPLMPVVWAASFFLTWLPKFGHGQHSAWNGALLWALIAGVVFIVAGWPEPPHRHPEGDHQEGASA